MAASRREAAGGLEADAAEGRLSPPLRIALVGAGEASAVEEARALAVGERLAAAGAVVVCGGLGGVMAAAARGARNAGGLTVGFLPGDAQADANPWIVLPVPTGMGEGRNVLVVRAAEAVVAVGGEWGTLSEVALARKTGRPVYLLGPGPASGRGLPGSDSPAAAAEWAVAAARRYRVGDGHGAGQRLP